MSKEVDKLKSEYKLLHKNIENERDRINIAKGQIEEIQKQIDSENEQKNNAKNNKLLYEKTALFCTSFTEKSQDSVSEIFDNIGTSGVRVFGGDRKLQFSFDKSKKKTPSVNIEVSQPWTNGETLVTDIMDAEGGAMVDVVALTLRLAMIKLISPEQIGPIFLDEVCRYIAKDESIRATGDFLREVSQELDRQFIIITHTNELLDYADKIFVFELGPYKTLIVKAQEYHETEN